MPIFDCFLEMQVVDEQSKKRNMNKDDETGGGG